jgi:F-box/leucine-rich repeat protein 2/20
LVFLWTTLFNKTHTFPTLTNQPYHTPKTKINKERKENTTATTIQQTMKKQKIIVEQQNPYNPFESLSEELIFTILDFLQPDNQSKLTKKSFSLCCKWFHALESKHRHALRPLRAEHIPTILARYPSIQNIDLTLCPRVNDTSLSMIAGAYNKTLRRIDLSRSRFFTGNGILNMAVSCVNLVELDLSNATELRDAAMVGVARAVNLEKLWLNRCKLVTDMGIGCIAVGCRKLKLISLKWCVGVADLGVDLIAIKCKQLSSMDLSYLPVSFFYFSFFILIIVNVIDF